MTTSNRLLNLLLVTTITLILSACNTKTSQDESNASAVSTPVTRTTGDTTPNEGSADTTPPRIALNGKASITLDQDRRYTELGATALDAVDGNISVIISGTVDTSTVGSYTVTYTAQDAAGNEANVTRTITVIDVTPPVITLNGESNITLEQNAVYTELGATALDAVDGNVSVTTTGNVDTSTIGNYIVTYSATDGAGNEVNATRTITVIDVTPPVITLNGQADVSLSVGESYVELGARAVDVVDGNVTVTTTGTVDTNTAGTYTITYTATDSVGNEANVTRNVTVVAPTFTSITLESNASTLNIGEKATLTLLGTYPDNSTEVLTKSIEYIITPSQSVALNASTLTALKDGTVTLQAKVGTLLSNTLTLDIAWVVDGYTLPPEPDEVLNNATLLGIDSNNNGVRDDVERWIYEIYDHPIERALLIQEAKMEQKKLELSGEMASDKNIALDFMNNYSHKSLACEFYWKRKHNNQTYILSSYSDISGYAHRYFSAPMEDKQYNTKDRKEANDIYEKALSGGVYGLVKPDIQKCEFNPIELMKDYK